MIWPARVTAVPFTVAMLGIASYSMMDAVMKALAIALGAYNAMLWRTVLALVIAASLFVWRRKRWPDRSILRLHVRRGIIMSMMAFLFFYGLFRFAVEFVRVPDAHLGYLAGGWLTMGQVLSMPMILVGILLLILAYRRPAAATTG